MASPLPEPTMQAFREAVAAYFRPFASELGVAWQRVHPALEGLSTAAVHVTIGVFRGHSASLCVKFRLNTPRTRLCDDDEGVFGLCWIQAFATGQAPEDPSPSVALNPETITSEVKRLATEFGQFAMPLLKEPRTDWAAIRAFVAKEVEASLPENVKRYGKWFSQQRDVWPS